MSFERVARLLLPPDDGDGRVVHADDAWRLDVGRSGGQALVWGREPTWEPAGPRLLRYAWRREGALLRLRRRPPAPLRMVGAHRWPHPFYRARVAPAVMWRLRAGVITEFARDRGSRRRLDAAAEAAGARSRLGAFHIAAAGGITAAPSLRRGGRAILRVGVAGSAAAPDRAARGLEALARLEHRCVPRLLAGGEEADAAWTLESLLPGRPPARVSAGLLGQVAAFCLELPRAQTSPTAFGEQMAAIGRRLPGFTEPLQALRTRVEPVIAQLPSVLAHGDLWASNLLCEGDTLLGVVDWEAWHPSSVPGTDLVHLIAATEAVSTQRTFAELLRDGRWRGRLLTAPELRRYWRELEIDPCPELLEAVTVAWWATQTLNRLVQLPADGADPDWVGRNVIPAIDSL